MWRRVGWDIGSKDSYKSAASIPSYFSPKMEAASSSETLLPIFQLTRRHIPVFIFIVVITADITESYVYNFTYRLIDAKECN
jgi:hypothetical protein